MPSQMPQAESILRGGGCGFWKENSLKSVASKSDNQDLQNFLNKFNFYVENICTKAVVAADSSESQEIMIALQWFIFQEENIYNLNKNALNVVKSYDLILEGIRKLLKSCLIFIRTDSFKCLYILQTTASLSKVIFSFHVLKEERFMKCDLQQEFLDISDELRQHMDIEKNDLIHNQMELYLFLTKTSFEMSPNNSNERQEILKGCLSGILGSIIEMKPNQELLESLFQGACHLYKQYVISNNRKQFEVYFSIDMLQWEIISYFKNEKFQNLDEILQQVKQIHDKLVKNSNVWKYHYLWVQMIGKIVLYNPLLTKQKLFQLGLKSDQIWKEFQRKGILIEMNHNNDEAVIQLNQLQNNQLSQNDRMIIEACFKEWEIFLFLKDFLINEHHLNIAFTFGSYLKSELTIEGKTPDENILAINNINRFLGFMISNKLLTLTKQNEEILEEIIKIYRNFMKDKQYNESTTLTISQQQIKKIIQKLEGYYQNIQDIIKIMRLNQGKLKRKNENEDFEKLNRLLSIQEILQIFILKNENDQIVNDEKNESQEWRKLILDELKNVDFKISFLKEVPKKLIEINQKEIEMLEKNLLQYFQNLVNNLCLYYENQCNQIQNNFSEFNLHLKKIMIIMYQMEAVPQIFELKKIKQDLSDMHFLKFIEILNYNNLKLKLKLFASKKSFSFILEKAKPEELRKIQDFINLDQFLLNIIEDFQQRRMTEDTNFDILFHAEIQNVKILEENFYYRLSKQKGIITYLIFKQGITEKQLQQNENDLELIEKEFGELFAKKTPSQFSIEKIKKIFEDLQVDAFLKQVREDKFNLTELKLEKEKYEIFLSQLKDIEEFRKCLRIEILNQLIVQTETLIQTLDNFGYPDKEIIKMLINEELIELQNIINLVLKNYDDYQIQKSPKDLITDYDKFNQIEQIDLNVKIAEKNESGIVENQNCKKFNFFSNESNRTYFSFIIKVVKLKKFKLQLEIELLNNLFQDVVHFSGKLDQIEKYKKEIQNKFQIRFQCRIQEFIQRFEQLQMSQVNLSQNEFENFHFYLDSLETKLFNSTNEQNNQEKINIDDFLNCLEFYLQEKLAQKRCSSKIPFEQSFLIQQTKKIYLEVDTEEFDEEESKQQFGLLDNLVQRFKDATNNEQWKIKQGLVFTIIQISSNCFSDTITSFCQKVLIQLWVQEKDQRVRNILKNQHLISMQMQILQKDWSTQHDRIAGKMQDMLTKIDELQESVSHEANLKKRDQFLKELDETTKQLDQEIENISEMGLQLRLITDFVNHIRKGLIRVEGKINEMKEQLKIVGNDIKFLRGKSVEQLFEIRKWKVLKETAYKNVKSIYLPLQTREIFHEKKNEQLSILINLEQINDTVGEVNEFLLEGKETVLLIHGVAGSGKSTTAKKIEEFIWKLHDNHTKVSNQVLIPVYIPLPSLKNPVFQAVEEALHQDEYGFDELQLKELKEMLGKKEFRLLLIMDSYDEMKLENIEKNLYINNKIYSKWSDPLVIFTTRSEIFRTSNYALWFAPDKKDKLKEIELQKFNPKQMVEYLKKFTIQSIKVLVFEIYEWQIQTSNKGVLDINKFENCWKNLQLQCLNQEIIKSNSETLLKQKEIENILSFLKQDEFINLKSNEALRSLGIKLSKLWSVDKYDKMMKQISLHKLVETPYMMEIVVQVLPQMMMKATEVVNLKSNFLKNFPNMLKDFYKSSYLIEFYKKQQKMYLDHKDNEMEYKFTHNIEEVLDKINYHEFAFEVWNKIEENSITIQFFSFEELYDLKKQLTNILEHNLQLQNVKIIIQIEKLIEVICNALFELNLTSYDFYEEFINQYHYQQIEKQRNLGKQIHIDRFLHDLKQYSKKLAKEMSKKQMTQVQYQQQGFLYSEEHNEENWLNEFFNDDDHQFGSYKKDLRSCSLIQQKGTNFQFVHKSLQEFYVAADLYAVLELSKFINKTIFSWILEWQAQEENVDKDCLEILQNQINLDKQFNVADESIFQRQQKLDTLKLLMILKKHEFCREDYSTETYTETRKYLIQKIQNENMIVEFLKFMVQLTANEQSFIQGGSNSLNLLIEMQVDLTGHNFEKIRIKNTSLRGGNFAKCNLNQSEFTNVNINGVNINGAQMFCCRWKDLTLNDLHQFDGHIGSVMSTCFSPDGTTLASGSADTSILIWDVKTGQQTAKLDGHKNAVRSVCFSPDGTILASCGGSETQYADNSICFWDVKTWQQIANLDDHSSYVKSVNFSPDGTTLASNSEDSICLWNVRNVQQIAKLKSQRTYSTHFSSDGTSILSCSLENKKICVWDVKSGEQKNSFNGPSDAEFTICFSSDGGMLAYVNEQKTFSFWDVKTRSKKKIDGVSSSTQSLCFSPDGTTLATCDNEKAIILWDVQKGQQKAKLVGHSGNVISVCFSPDGTTLASGSSDNSVRLWSVKIGQQKAKLDAHSEAVFTVNFSPDGTIFATGSEDKSIRLWDVKTGQQKAKLDGHSSTVHSVNFSPDGTTLASGSGDNSICLWDVKTGQQKAKLVGHSETVISVCFSPDGTSLVSGGSDMSIRLWDIKTQVELAKFDHPMYVFSVCFSPDGANLGSGGGELDKSSFVYIWNIGTKKLIKEAIQSPDKYKWAVFSVCFSSDGTLLASGGQDGIIRLWNVEIEFTIAKEVEIGHSIWSVCFSPNGTSLAVCCGCLNENCNEYFICLWDLKTEQSIKKLEGHNEIIRQVCFSPDGTLLASCGQDCSIRLWDVGIESQHAKLNSHTEKVVLVDIAPDGTTFASSSYDNSICLWDAKTGKQIAKLDGHSKCVNSVCYSPDSTTLASGSSDKSICLWDVKIGQKKAKLDGHSDAVISICFSPDSITLASCGYNQSIYLWDIKSGQQILHTEDCYQNIFAQFKHPVFQSKILPNDIGSNITLLLISQQLIFQSKDALIFQGEIVNHLGTDLKKLFKQRGSVILLEHLMKN